MNLTREETSKRLAMELERLFKQNVRPEEISFRTGCSYNSIKNWHKGRRVPRVPTIRLLEQTYGIKVL